MTGDTSTGTSSGTTTGVPDRRGPLGAVLRDDEGRRLEFVRRYAQPPHDVWAAITDPERTARWFGTWTGDPASGTVHLTMTEDEGATPQPATIVECEPAARLVLVLPNPDGPWPLSVLLEPDGAGTRLVFTHRLAEPHDASSVGPGWQYYLDRLGAVVAGAPVPDDFDAYYPALAEAYPLPG